MTRVNSRIQRAPRCLRAAPADFAASISAVALIVLTALALAAGPASAGNDEWHCLSTLGTFCGNAYYHHEAFVQAAYYGSGSLPVFAGSDCVESGCNPPSWIFSIDSAQYGSYNFVVACYSSCNSDSPHLGVGEVENEHTSSHTVYGDDAF